MMNPTISVLKRDELQTRYRIEGGELSGDWKAREGNSAWCEFTVWHGSEQLGSYGGEVWPTAWTQLFESLPNTISAGSGRIRITAAGKEALRNARQVNGNS